MATEKDVQDGLMAVIQLFTAGIGVRSFKEAGVVTTLSQPYGLVIKVADGSEFQLSIAECERDDR